MAVKTLNESACLSVKRVKPPTSADAPPPKPLSSATICGIWIILTFFVIHAPIAAPRSIETIITTRAVLTSVPKTSYFTIVSAIARAIETAERLFPICAFSTLLMR